MNKVILILCFISIGIQAVNAKEDIQYTKLTKQAWEHYQAREYKQSGQKYLQAFTTLENNQSMTDKEINHRFNAACVLSLDKNIDAAFIQLFKIAEFGKYSKYDELTQDSDLNNLHNDSRWKQVTQVVNKNYQLVKPLSKKELELVFENYQKASAKVFSSGSTLADINRLYDFYTSDFIYNHPKYGGVYSRELLYNNTVKFQAQGRYNNSKKRNTLSKIVGLNSIVIEQKYEGDKETTMTLFEFRKDKISSIKEYW